MTQKQRDIIIKHAATVDIDDPEWSYFLEVWRDLELGL